MFRRLTRFFDFINLLKQNGITSGCSATQFCGDAPVTRGQMAVFVIRALLGGDTFPYVTTPVFTDVAASNPFSRTFRKCRIGNYGGVFSDNVLSRRPRDARTDGGIPGPGEAEHRAVAAVPLLDGGLLFRRPDVPSIFHICAEDETVGITAGCSDTNYCPDSSTTRGQMAVS